jgi:hypothetical protein
MCDESSNVKQRVFAFNSPFFLLHVQVIQHLIALEIAFPNLSDMLLL